MVATAVATTISGAAATRSEWGDVAAVVVATEPVPAGSDVGVTNFELAEWPTALVPTGALSAVPAGARTNVDMAAGEVLSEQRLAGSGVGRTAALLGDDEVAVSVPLGEPGAVVEPGDLVDIYAPSAGGESFDSLPALEVRLVARGAKVLSSRSDAVTLAVDDRTAAATAAAALGGLVSIVVVG